VAPLGGGHESIEPWREIGHRRVVGGEGRDAGAERDLGDHRVERTARLPVHARRLRQQRARFGYRGVEATARRPRVGERSLHASERRLDFAVHLVRRAERIAGDARLDVEQHLPDDVELGRHPRRQVILLDAAETLARLGELGLDLGPRARHQRERVPGGVERCAHAGQQHVGRDLDDPHAVVEQTASGERRRALGVHDRLAQQQGRDLGLPLVVVPEREGGHRGAHRPRAIDHLAEALAIAEERGHARERRAEALTGQPFELGPTAFAQPVRGVGLEREQVVVHAP
jgi:hypothetical protein